MIDRYAVARVDIGLDGWQPLAPPVAGGWLRRDGQWTHLVQQCGKARRLCSFLAEKLPLLQVVDPVAMTLSPDHRRWTLASSGDSRWPTKHCIVGCKTQVSISVAILRDMDLRCVLLGALSAAAYRAGWLVTSAVFLGFLWHQLRFTAHDLGHVNVTHSWLLDRVIGMFVANLIGGLSIGWWVDNRIHNTSRIAN